MKNITLQVNESDTVVIGADPDSRGNGIAVYINSELIILKNMDAGVLTLFLQQLKEQAPLNISIHVEDVTSISAVFKGRFNKNESLESKLMKAQNVGMCKQAQINIEQIAALFDIPVFKYKPSSAWKSAGAGKREFMLVTKWKKQSNEDTRSAAYFGFLGCGGYKSKARRAVLK